MRNVANPFKPTAGGEPPLLIGRRKVIRDFEKGLDNGVGAPGRIMLITGARGTGKTVILTVLGDKARARKWDVIEETASEGLCERLVNELRDRDGLLDRLTIKPSLSFAGASVSLGEAELTPKRMPETLRKAMAERITLLEKHHAGLLISIDETQAADRSDMIAIATAIQHQIRERRNIAIVFAGLPQMVSDLFNDEVITFLRRAKMNVLTGIPVDEVRDAFRTTFHDSGMHIDERQLQTAAAATCGYPYMIQLVGYHIWDAADMRNSDEISTMTSRRASPRRESTSTTPYAFRNCTDCRGTTAHTSRPWHSPTVLRRQRQWPSAWARHPITRPPTASGCSTPT